MATKLEQLLVNLKYERDNVLALVISEREKLDNEFILAETTRLNSLVTDNINRMREFLVHIYALMEICGDEYDFCYHNIEHWFDYNQEAFEKCVNQVIQDEYNIKLSKYNNNNSIYTIIKIK